MASQPEGSTPTQTLEGRTFLDSDTESEFSNSSSVEDLFEQNRLHSTVNPFDPFLPTIRLTNNLGYEPWLPDAPHFEGDSEFAPEENSSQGAQSLANLDTFDPDFWYSHLTDLEIESPLSPSLIHSAPVPRYPLDPEEVQLQPRSMDSLADFYGYSDLVTQPDPSPALVLGSPFTSPVRNYPQPSHQSTNTQGWLDEARQRRLARRRENHRQHMQRLREQQQRGHESRRLHRPRLRLEIPRSVAPQPILVAPAPVVDPQNPVTNPPPTAQWYRTSDTRTGAVLGYVFRVEQFFPTPAALPIGQLPLPPIPARDAPVLLPLPQGEQSLTPTSTLSVASAVVEKPKPVFPDDSDSSDASPTPKAPRKKAQAPLRRSERLRSRVNQKVSGR